MLLLPVGGSGSATVAGMEGNPGGGKKGGGGAEGEETEEGKEVAPADNSHSGTKPQLRVYIPGQKEFVPKTVSSVYHCVCLFCTYSG